MLWVCCSDRNLAGNLGGSGSGSTKFRFFQANFGEISIFFQGISKKIISIFLVKFFKNFLFLKANFRKMSIFQANVQKISIFSGNLKKFYFPGKNCSFTATSGQMILFLFKINHFRTYFLYMIGYYNISLPVHDSSATPRPQVQNLGVANSQPHYWRPWSAVSLYVLRCLNETLFCWNDLLF